MSWTQVFSVLSDEHVSGYNEYAAPEEKERLRSLFSGSRVDTVDSTMNLICLTLSPQLQGQEELLPPWSCGGENEEVAPVVPLPEPLDPEEFLPFIREAVLSLAADHPDTMLRIYLDPSWQAIASKLVDGGCEVVLMDRPSDGPNPAALWRYLALEEEGRAITFMSLESLPLIGGFMERTKALQESGLKVWRVPMDRRRNYRPINPDNFACLQAYPTLELLCAYSWFMCNPLAKIPLPSEDRFLEMEPSSACERQASWIRPDLDEFFLLAVLYPRVAFDGMLTLVEADDQHSRWLILDTEYATWANPSNETIFVVALTPPEQEGESSINFRSSAMLEKLFHLNRYPEHYDAWIKQAEEPEDAHASGCDHHHEHDHQHSH